MEAVVVGAAVGATVRVVLKNLLSFPVDEIGLFWNFKEAFRKLKDSIGMLLDFLEDAEMEQVPEKSVQSWLMSLEAVAFDADYVFDRLNYEVLRKKVVKDHKMKKKVSSFFSTSNPIAFRRKMAREIKRINKKLRLINKLARGLGLPTRNAGASARGAGTDVPAYLETDSFSVDPVFVGRENDVAKIVEMVTSNSSTEQLVSVVPIVGMGGLGKTTLTRKVYNDQTIISHFGKRFWIHVGKNFDPVTILKSVASSTTGENVDGSRQLVLQKLQKCLVDEKYLLVLDNVWNVNSDMWDNFMSSLRGITSVKGNVIMITTRSGVVANIVKTRDIHELGVLSEEDCWLIIKAKAFEEEGIPSEFETTFEGEGIPSELETTRANIAKRCGGLPLAARVVGSLLCGKSINEWIYIEKKWISNGRDEDTVSKILKLSFDNLPLPSLKKCFTLCAVFPRGWQIEKDMMIQLWMAEGFIQNDQEKDMEIVGNEVVNLLVQSSLLLVWQRDESGNVKCCVMHDLVYDLASSVLNPKFSDDSYRVRYITRPFKDDSSPVPREEHAKTLRALFFRGNLSNIKLSNFVCLHVLILHNEGMEMLPMGIENLISLRLLDISYTRITCLPDSIGNLYHLQTLRAKSENSIRTFLKRLPKTFKYLVNLRHLYIPNIELPSEIGKLRSLQTLPYFQVGNKEGCRIMELGRLENLKGEIEIHNLGKVSDKEEAKNADLIHKSNIVKLKLVWNESREDDRSNDENVLEGLQPHRNLKSLEIKGFKGRNFPLWTMRMTVRKGIEDPWIRLDKLLEIHLSDCKECEEIPMLGHLPLLKSLHLQHLPNVKSIGSTFYGIKELEVNKDTIIIVFPALEELELIDMGNLIAWSEGELSSSYEDMGNLIAWSEGELSSSYEAQLRELSMFRRLEYLKIVDCRLLKSAPSNFPILKELEIDNMESGLPLENICGSKLTSLKKLKIRAVDELKYLPSGLFSSNRDLLELDISTCKNLMHLVRDLKPGEASLRSLEIFNCPNLTELPKGLHNLNALEELIICSCRNLKSIPYPIDSQLPVKGFTSLRHLQFSYCSELTNLPCQMLESCAPSLQRLLLMGSKSLTNLPEVMTSLDNMSRLINLRIVDVPNVPKLTDVATMGSSLCSLEELVIGGCSDCLDYVSVRASLDHIFESLQSLRGLTLYGMEQWDTLPNQLKCLATLHRLCLWDFGIEVLPEWLERLSSLKTLELFNCQKLRHLPPKKAIQGLTYLHIRQCLLLQQNLNQEANDDSEWYKVSHIPYIEVDGLQLSAHPM